MLPNQGSCNNHTNMCEIFGSEHWQLFNPPVTHHEICAFLRAFHGLKQPTDSRVLWDFCG